jgi:hypothetical protein
MVVARMFNDYEIGSNIIVPLVAAAVVSLIAKFILVLWESESLLTSVVNFVYGVFVYTCTFLFLINSCDVQIPEFFLSIKYFLTASEAAYHYKVFLDSLYSFLAAPIFYFILQIMALNLTNDLLYYFDYNDSEVKGRVKGCVITSGVFLGVAAVVAIYNVGTLSAVVVSAVKSNLLLLMITLAILLAFYFPTVSSVKTVKASNERSYSAPESTSEPIATAVEEKESQNNNQDNYWF